MTTEVQSIESKKHVGTNQSGGENLSSHVWQGMYNEKQKPSHPVNVKPDHPADPGKVEIPKDGIEKKIAHEISTATKSTKSSRDFTTSENLDDNASAYDRSGKKPHALEGTRHPHKPGDEPKIPKDVQEYLEKLLAKYRHSKEAETGIWKNPKSGPEMPGYPEYPSGKPGHAPATGPVHWPTGGKTGTVGTTGHGGDAPCPAPKPIVFPHIPLHGPLGPHPYEIRK